MHAAKKMLVTANALSSPILVTLMMGAIRSSETSVFTRATRRTIPDDGILLDLFPSSGEERETPTQLGPIESANLNHWIWFSPEDGSLPVSETCVLVFRIPDDGKTPKTPTVLFCHRQNPLGSASVFSANPGQKRGGGRWCTPYPPALSV
jgi:hypothetical protein